MDAKYVQPPNNGCRVHKLHIDVILRKILQAGQELKSVWPT
jgi:hypothetical protein